MYCPMFQLSIYIWLYGANDLKYVLWSLSKPNPSNMFSSLTYDFVMEKVWENIALFDFMQQLEPCHGHKSL